MTDSDKLQNVIRWLGSTLDADTVERIIRGEEAALDLALLLQDRLNLLQERDELRSRVAMLEATR